MIFQYRKQFNSLENYYSISELNLLKYTVRIILAFMQNFVLEQWRQRLHPKKKEKPKG